MPDKSVNAGQILAKVGEAKNWLYTKYLLKNRQTSGLPVDQVVKPVWRGVEQQSPRTSSSFSADFYFIPE